MTSKPEPLSLWEKADLITGQLVTLGTVLYTAVTGIFRGESGAKGYGLHIGNAMFRKLILRLNARQLQHLSGPTSYVYETTMTKLGLQPESVPLNHGAQGHWIGNKNAKQVLVYYHGHITFYNNLITTLNAEGHDLAIFFLSYTLTPPAVYPTQLRQAVEALRYILSTNRPASNVLIGGDSAGGNLALAVLLHLSHRHPDIEPLCDVAPLAGVVAWAPWASFAQAGTSMWENGGKDMIGGEILDRWSRAYLGGKEGDAWSEPARAPVEWWRGAKVEEVLFLAGRDEVLLDGIEGFVEGFKSVVPNTTYVVGHGETHVAPIYCGSFIGEDTQQGSGLREWFRSRL
ncbi:hypothetical protein BBP40_000056 [Aspergillus hancockii]|nr:hypothetical protein BBP40_000056 [Aspergillus hancockii]